MKIDFPVKHIDGNLVFTHDDKVWAYYKIDGFGYDFLSEDEKLVPFQQQLAFLSEVGLDLHYLTIPNPTDVTNILDRTMEEMMLKNYPLQQNGINFFKQVQLALSKQKELTETSEYHYYLGIQLDPNKNRYKSTNVGLDFLSNFKQFWVGLNSPLYSAVGLLSDDILESEIQAYRGQAKTIEVAVANSFNSVIKRLTAVEIVYNIEKMFSTRNNSSDVRVRTQFECGTKVIGREQEKGSEYVAIRSNEKDFYDLQSVNIDQITPKTLLYTRITEKDELEELYAQFLTISNMPMKSVHPNSEWLYDIQLRLPFPILVSIRADHQPNEMIRKRLGNVKLEFQDQREEARKGGQNAGLDVITSERETIELEQYFKTHGFPSYTCSFVFKVTAESEEQLRNRIELLRSELTKRGIKLEAPFGEQLSLMYECMMGGRKYINDYQMEVAPTVLAGLMFGATTNIGDNRGFYIGSTSRFQKPVFIQPDLAAKAFDGLGNVVDSISVLVAGMTGKGKSFFMNLFVYLSTLTGSQGLIIDPKGDRGGWVDGLPFIPKEFINVWTLGADKADAGSLDPFRTSNDIDDGKELAVDILTYLTNVKLNDMEYSMISKAVDEVSSMEDPCIGAVITNLKYKIEHDRVDLGEQRVEKLISLVSQLDTLKNDKLSMLLFGEQGQQFKVLNQRTPIQVLMIQNLSLPKTDQEIANPRAKQRVSEAIMLSITAWTKTYMIKGDRSVHKYILQDEASAIERSPIGAELMDFIVRMGRYYNTTLMKGSQNASDHTSNVANIGMKFSFALKERKEAEQMLQYLNLPVTDATANTIMRLGRGECLFQDIYGRSAVIRVNPVFIELLDAFDSSTATKEEREREKTRIH